MRVTAWASVVAAIVACGSEEVPASHRVALVDGPLSFAPERDLSDGDIRGLSAVDLGDIDGDGDPDVAVFEGGKHAGGRITFGWLEASGGAWVQHDLPRPEPLRPFIGAAKLDDLDGDGDVDVVVSMDNHSGGPRSAYLYWLENVGEGADWNVHDIATDLPVHHINDMVVADMDGDARRDVVVRALSPNQLLLYFQDGADAWEERIVDTTPFGPSGEGFAVGDMDREGHLDITVCGHWLRAPANPRAEAYTAHAIDAGFSDVNANVKQAIGDIDGDGRNDVVISPAEGYRGGSNHVLAWYRAPADPTEAGWRQHVLAEDFNGGHTVLLSDLDGDADLDLVSGVPWSQWGQTANVTLFFNQDGNLASPQTIVTGKGLYTGAVGDVGGDGDVDIVGQNTYAGDSRPYLYAAEGTAAPPPPADAGTAATDGGAVPGAEPTADAGVPDGSEPVDPETGGVSGGAAEGPDESGALEGGCGVAGSARSMPGVFLAFFVLLGWACAARYRRREPKGRVPRSRRAAR